MSPSLHSELKTSNLKTSELKDFSDEHLNLKLLLQILYRTASNSNQLALFFTVELLVWPYVLEKLKRLDGT